jgi:hypothetical protein
MAAFAVLFPSAVVTIIVVVPAFRGVTTPDALTVAISGLLLVQVIWVFVAVEGTIVAVRVPVGPPAFRVKVAGVRVTSVTAVPSVPADGGFETGLEQLNKNSTVATKNNEIFFTGPSFAQLFRCTWCA